MPHTPDTVTTPIRTIEVPDTITTLEEFTAFLDAAAARWAAEDQDEEDAS